ARAPSYDLGQDRHQCPPAIRKAVFHSSRHDRIDLAAEQPAFLQLPQLAAQDARRDGPAEAAMQKRAPDLPIAMRSVVEDAQDVKLVAAAENSVESDRRAQPYMAHVQSGQARYGRTRS